MSDVFDNAARPFGGGHLTPQASGSLLQAVPQILEGGGNREHLSSAKAAAAPDTKGGKP